MTQTVRIYKPTKTAMQSGRANTMRWLVEYEPSDPQEPDALMGWAGSHDTNRQLKLWFTTKEEAIAFASQRSLAYRLEEPHERVVRPKSYADNFLFRRA